MLNNPCPAHPALECWRWLAFKIACALEPDSPELLGRYLETGRQLLEMGLLDARLLAEQTLDLLFRSAHEVLLPWHWRCQCLDKLYLPLQTLTALAEQDEDLQQRLVGLRLRLAGAALLPSEMPQP